ncbi:uncharacterized protein DEA37_0010555 [Paragonimus westermani]|uniref:Uncharacterized protein n=1 Tax=Paragonimus westermani TaxID=34504 RepID=A0A5J4P199_9TREM|nr:uncharacterized protein DEA37_0010555 [Paragonimus westermani]
MSAGVYFLLRINVIRFDSRSIRQSVSTLSSQKLAGMGYALLAFADLAAYLIAGSLLTILLIDLVVRIKLLDEQAAAVDSEIAPFGFDLDGQPGCSIGYYYIDATSEDFITKV